MYYDYIWSSLKIELSDDVLLQCTKWTFVYFIAAGMEKCSDVQSVMKRLEAEAIR